jgi:hypothetical protein
MVLILRSAKRVSKDEDCINWRGNQNLILRDAILRIAPQDEVLF